MKTTNIFLASLAFLFLMSKSVDAQRSWRVNQTAAARATFTSLQAAIDSVANGDTLYVEPGNYGTINLTKNLKMYGVGFDVTLYDSATVFKAESQIGNMTIAAGGSGSAIEGFRITSLNFAGSNSTINNILIKRCLFSTSLELRAASGIYNLSNILISQSIINNFSIGSNVTGSTVSGVIVSNCILQGSIFSIQVTNLGLNNFSGAIFSHNVIKPSTFSPASATFQNNIIHVGLGSATASTFNNNICTSVQPTTGGNSFGSGNVFSVGTENIFVSAASVWTSSQATNLVQNFQLKAGSPAIGAASNGGNCGIFGGNAPMPFPPTPSIPQIYEFDADVNSNPSTNQLQFRIKARPGN